MKNEIKQNEQINEIKNILLAYQPLIDIQYDAFGVIAEALVKSGFSNNSDHIAEREMLGSQIKVLKQRLNNKYIEVDNLNRDYRNAFERLKAQQREIAQLKAEQKQAQIDMLEKLKSYVHCYFPNDDEDCVSQHVVLVSDIDMFINKIRSEQIKDVDAVINTLQN